VSLFASGGLGLVIFVLVLRIWPCLHHWKHAHCVTLHYYLLSFLVEYVLLSTCCDL